MASHSSSADPDGPELITAYFDADDRKVRWMSSNDFYLRQMKWCVSTVTNFWRDSMRRRRGVWPTNIPLTIRFCMSWLSGIDCTNWSVRHVCRWLTQRLSRGHRFTSMMLIAFASQRVPESVEECARTQLRRPSSHLRTSRLRLPPPRFLWRVETWGQSSYTAAPLSTDAHKPYVFVDKDDDGADSDDS